MLLNKYVRVLLNKGTIQNYTFVYSVPLGLTSFVGNNSIECFDDNGLLSINFTLALYAATVGNPLKNVDFSLEIPASLDDILDECRKECVDKLKKELKNVSKKYVELPLLP